MKNTEGITNGLSIGDLVRHPKTETVGIICGFEWSGVRRALVKRAEASGVSVISVKELVLINKHDQGPKNEE